MRRLDHAAELLDGPLDPVVLADNLHDMSLFNRFLGGAALSTSAIESLVAGAPATVLDVGTGGADIPLRLAIHGWEITATDVRPEIVDIARRATAASAVVVRQARLEDEHENSFDVVHSSMVVHHLEPREVIAFLRQAGRVARIAVVVNDLDRRQIWYAGARLLTRVLTSNVYTRHDAPLSVRRAYTPNEVVALARRAGLRAIWRRRAFPGYRYALVFVRDGDGNVD